MTEHVYRVAAPLRQQVIELLREAIVSLAFKPGERLVEKALCDRYQVSRTVVREALRQLEAEGLVSMVPHRGPVVATLTVVEAESLYEVRAALEALAGKLFAERATGEERQRLADTLRQVEDALAAGDLAAQLSAKDTFYDALFDGARNEIIRTTLRTVHARVRMLRGLSLQAEGRQPQTLAELRTIVDAVTRGDGAAAWTACNTHVQAAARVALDRLRQSVQLDGEGT